MKYKTTKRAVMDGYGFVISVRCADLQYLLHHKSPVVYTSGKCGWNADIYDFGNDADAFYYCHFDYDAPIRDIIFDGYRETTFGVIQVA